MLDDGFDGSMLKGERTAVEGKHKRIKRSESDGKRTLKIEGG